MPAANRFMLYVMAAIAEHEAKVISDRTVRPRAGRRESPRHKARIGPVIGQVAKTNAGTPGKSRGFSGILRYFRGCRLPPRGLEPLS
jgi:hypothetical protein